MHQIEMYVDELASCVSTPESEYEDIEWDLRRYIFGDAECRFKAGVTPSQISPSTCIYVVDFGALACYGSGFEWKADRLSRELIRAIEDNPSVIFLLWSRFTVNNYQYIALEDKGLDCWSDYNQPKNVILFDDFKSECKDDRLNTTRKLLGLPEPIVDLDEYYNKKLKNIITKEDDDILSSDEEVD